MMESNGFDPFGSCFLFDFDAVEAGLNVVQNIDVSLAFEFTDKDLKWLRSMTEDDLDR